MGKHSVKVLLVSILSKNWGHVVEVKDRPRAESKILGIRFAGRIVMMLGDGDDGCSLENAELVLGLGGPVGFYLKRRTLEILASLESPVRLPECV